MKPLTNKYNLPQTLVDALAYDTHKVAGSISVSQLIDAPQIRVLKKKHINDVQEDVSEKIFALLGTAIHGILERANIKEVRKRAFLLVIDTLKAEADQILAETGEQDMTPDISKRVDAMQKVAKYLFSLLPSFFPELESRYIFETTLRIEIDGEVLYGTFDLYDKIEKRLKDYKVCSVWNYVFPEARKKWNAQMNAYAYLLQQEGHEVLGCDIVAIFRDWSATKLGISKGDYPPQQVMQIEIPILSMDINDKWIRSRMELHRQADLGNIPECTGKERWSEAGDWAIKTPSAKRAVRVFLKEAEAYKFKEENQNGYKGLYIEARPGRNKRCDEYCPVRDICPQRAAMVNNAPKPE